MIFRLIGISNFEDVAKNNSKEKIIKQTFIETSNYCFSTDKIKGKQTLKLRIKPSQEYFRHEGYEFIINDDITLAKADMNPLEVFLYASTMGRINVIYDDDDSTSAYLLSPKVNRFALVDIEEFVNDNWKPPLDVFDSVEESEKIKQSIIKLIKELQEI